MWCEQGIEYEAFILDTAVDMIHTIVNVEESMQYKRTQAWKQVSARAAASLRRVTCQSHVC